MYKLYLILLFIISTTFGTTLFERISKESSIAPESFNSYELFLCDSMNRTPLMLSAFLGKNDLVTMFLQSGADVNAQDQFGTNALTWAALGGHLSTIHLLVDSGITYNKTCNIKFEDGSYIGSPMNAVAYSKSNNSIEILSYLVKQFNASIDEYEYDIKMKTFTGYTPLMWAVNENSLKMVSYLLNKGANINALCNSDEMSPLILASINNTEILDTLIAHGADISDTSITNFAYTPLRAAIVEGNIDAFIKLLKAGAPIYQNDSYRMSLLELATIFHQSEIIKILLEKTSDSLFMELRSSYYSSYDTLPGEHGLIKLASTVKDPAILKMFLKRYNSIFPSDTINAKYILEHLFFNEESSIKVYGNGSRNLLPVKVDTNNTDNRIINSMQVIKSAGISLNVGTYTLNSLLQDALINGYINSAQALVDLGADIFNKNEKNDLMELSIEAKQLTSIKFLIDKGFIIEEQHFPASLKANSDNSMSFYGLPNNQSLDNTSPIDKKTFFCEALKYLTEQLYNNPSQMRRLGSKALLCASQNGCILEIKKLLKSSVSSCHITFTERYRDTTFDTSYALHYAVLSNNPEVVNLITKKYYHSDSIIDAAINLSLETSNEKVLPILFKYRSKKSDTLLINCLFNTGFEPTIAYILKNLKGPLRDTALTTIFQQAYNNKNNWMIRNLIKNGYQLPDEMKIPILSIAINKEDIQLIEMMLDQKTPLRYQDEKGNSISLLLSALENKKFKSYKYLEKRGISLNKKERTILFKFLLEGNEVEEAHKLFKDGIEQLSIKEDNTKEFLKKLARWNRNVSIYYLIENTDLIDSTGISLILLGALNNSFYPDHYLINYLINKKPNFSILKETPTLLSTLASQKTFLPYILLLIDNGFPINSQGEYDKTAICQAAYSSNNTIYDSLLARGADFNIGDKNGKTPLLYLLNNEDTVRSADLLKRGQDINSRQKDGKTILHSVIESKKNNKSIPFLLANGANPDLTDKNGNNAIWSFLRNDNFEKAIELLPYIKKPISNSEGETYLHKVFNDASNDTIITPFLNLDIDINAKNKKGYTALDYAIKNKYISIAPLIAAGAILTEKNRDGLTPLQAAIKTGNRDAVKYFLKHNPELETPSDDGKYTVHIAAAYGLEYLTMLKNAGVQINRKDKNGETPLMYAAEKGDHRSINALRQWGANTEDRDNDGKKAIDHVTWNSNYRDDAINSLTIPKNELLPIPATDVYNLTGYWWLMEKIEYKTKNDTTRYTIDNTTHGLSITNNKLHLIPTYSQAKEYKRIDSFIIFSYDEWKFNLEKDILTIYQKVKNSKEDIYRPIERYHRTTKPIMEILKK